MLFIYLFFALLRQNETSKQNEAMALILIVMAENIQFDVLLCPIVLCYVMHHEGQVIVFND